MGCAHSSAAGTVEARREPSIRYRRNEVKFVPPKPGQLYVRPEEHKKSSGYAAQAAEEQADWKGLWRPSNVDEAGSLLVRQLQLQDHSCSFESGALLEVVCNAFQSGSACVALMEQPHTVLVWSGTGLCEPGTHAPWMLDFLQCCLQSANNEVAIVDDAHKDARVKDSEAVADGSIASFVGAPLVAANGICIGALCVFRGVPTRYDAIRVALLAGLAELTMRQLEADWAREHTSIKGLQRPKAAYESATMLVDASQHAWKVIYINSPASKITGVSLHMAGASAFWGLFSSPDSVGDHPWNAYTDETENSRDFMLHNVQRRGSSNHSVFSLAFTPVTKVMDESTVPIGIPCMTEAQVGTRHFFFVRVSVQNDSLPKQHIPHQAVPIPGLELGTLLAVSPYGRTHRAFYKHQPVAVKIVSNGRRNVRYRDGRPLAIAVTEGLPESGVPLVRTFQYANHCTRSRPSHLGKPEQATEGERCVCGEAISNCACEAFEDDRESLCQMSDSACSLNEGEPSTTTQETWLVQEYCSLGTLQLAIAQGKFQKSNGRACCTAILDVACDVAHGMHLLHSRGVSHGNLCTSSVLLTPSTRASYGFRAKVADYGILRELDTHGFATPQCYPTLAHLAPEVLLQGKISKAGDVYAFGVMLWEMAAGQQMFAGMPWAQVMAAITLRHSRPRLPLGRAMPSGLDSVLRMCLATSPADRPSFFELAAIIRAVRTSSLQKAEEKRASMALDRAVYKRSCPITTDSARQLLGQENIQAVQQVSNINTKQAAAELWISDPWRQRSVKPQAVDEWKRISTMAQLAAKAGPPGSLDSRSARCPRPAEPERPKRASTSPPGANMEKPSSPYASLTKAKAANMRLNIEMRRAGHGRSGKTSSAVPSRPILQLAHTTPVNLPPSLLYQSSRQQSSVSGSDNCSQSSSSPDRPNAGTKSILKSSSNSSKKDAVNTPAIDDRLGINEMARMRSSLGGSVGSYSSCHSESGYTHTAAHLSFTEIKRQKQKRLAASLSALRNSLMPDTESVKTCAEAKTQRDCVSLEDTTYVPSRSLENIRLALPQLRMSTDYKF